jgi:putative ABC transport system permease protein
MRTDTLGGTPVWRLLLTFSWQELRHQGVRHAVAVLAVMLGVGLAFSVHLINVSALTEFGSAIRSVNGQADLVVTSAKGDLDESVYAQFAQHADVEAVSPIIDVRTQVDGQPLHVFGVDPLVARMTTPALVAQASGEGVSDVGLAWFDPGAIFLNDQARSLVGRKPHTTVIQVQSGLKKIPLRIAGSVAARGEAIAVMDIAAAQETFGLLGKVSRLDVKLKEGRQAHALLASLRLPPGVQTGLPADSETQATKMSRAYRVNLSVLALIALFTGAFLVFSTLSLSVTKRMQQFALLGVLGLSARERLLLVLLESAVMGLVGALLGVALGTVVAALTLALVGGDLGAAYFAGSAPPLAWSRQGALLYGGLGVLASVVGAWIPARRAQRMAPAQSLKGASPPQPSGLAIWAGPLWLIVGALLTWLPPMDGMPVGAYLAIACLMAGGIGCVPGVVQVTVGMVMQLWPQEKLQRSAGLFLALERVRHMRQAATVAIAGIVVSLGLSVALTVMVSSFRGAITEWLDTLLPADVYVRTSLFNEGSDTVHLDQGLLDAVNRIDGVRRVMGVRVTHFNLRQGLPPVVVVARPLVGPADDPAYKLPLIGAALPPRVGMLGVYVSEIAADLYGARQGATLDLPLRPGLPPVPALVLGVWRDYAHQQGALIVDLSDYQRISGDRQFNDLALWLAPGLHVEDVYQEVRLAARQQQFDETLLLFTTPQAIRESTLAVFDRSFAVTSWLQAVALGMGLFGISASFSGQILARRKEFGLLSHLGFTADQIMKVLAIEGAALTAVGSLMGLALGIAVSLVLVYVVNPQSFHWTMSMHLPWQRIGLMSAGMVAAGAFTAWLAGRKAVGRDVVGAVKEDW